MLDEGGGDAYRAHEIGGDDRGHLGVVHHGGGVVDLHDAGVVDDGVEFGIVGDEFFADGGDVGGICDVEFDGLHAGVCVGDFGEVGFAAAGDDDLVAEFVECFGPGAAETGGAAGDEDSVVGEVHFFSCTVWLGVGCGTGVDGYIAARAGLRTKTGWLRDRSRRDFSATRADAFAGANAKKRRRLAPVEMTGLGKSTLSLASMG